MKAYMINDENYNEDCIEIIFAETKGKAISYALSTESFEDYSFIELRARRAPELDRYYRGDWKMDWMNPEDRIAIVKEYGFHCNYESFDIKKCPSCVANEYCNYYLDQL